MNNCKHRIGECESELGCKNFLVAEAKKLEIVAEECHKQWSRWTAHLLSKMNMSPCCGRILDDTWIERWERQIDTPYKDLSEVEKESDRIEARKILEALNNG